MRVFQFLGITAGIHEAIAGHDDVPNEIKNGDDKENSEDGLNNIVEVELRLINMDSVRQKRVFDGGVERFDQFHNPILFNV